MHQRTGSGSVAESGLVSIGNLDKTVLRFGGDDYSGDELEFNVAVGDFNRSSERRVVGLSFPEIGGIEIDLKVCT